MKRALQSIVIALVVSASPAYAQQGSMEKLMEAVERGDAAETASYLARGLDPNTSDAKGQTILMVASRLGHIEVVKALLSRRADPNRQTAHGDTALMVASLAGQLEVVKLLFAAGARMDTRGWTALHYAAFSGSPDIIRFLVLRGADKNALAPNSDTPLLLAVRNNKTDAAKALIDEHADLSYRDQNGLSVLALAKAKGEQEIVELLSKAGAPE